MSKVTEAVRKKQLRKQRIRATIVGTSERPRLSVFISHQHVSAQIIDDSKSKTLVHVSTAGKKSASGTKTEMAAWVGAELGKKAKTAKIKKVVLDRNGKLYHGRVKALADAARKEGLEF